MQRFDVVFTELDWVLVGWVMRMIRVPGSQRGMTFQVPLLQVKVPRPCAGSYWPWHSMVKLRPCSTSAPVDTLTKPCSTDGTTHGAAHRSKIHHRPHPPWLEHGHLDISWNYRVQSQRLQLSPHSFESGNNGFRGRINFVIPHPPPKKNFSLHETKESILLKAKSSRGSDS